MTLSDAGRDPRPRLAHLGGLLEGRARGAARAIRV